MAAVKGQRSGDDHMNLKWLDSSGGRVFAAIKTSFTSASQPLIQLLALNGPTWSAHTIATVSECPNRVLVLIDESTRRRLRTFATYPKPSGTTNAGVCTSSGGAIYEKSTPLDNINFTTTKTASYRGRRPVCPQRDVDEAEPQQFDAGHGQQRPAGAGRCERHKPVLELLRAMAPVVGAGYDGPDRDGYVSGG